ncbi:ATP-binding protein [Nocardiopsis gilva YIM 90087]|uniref:histidine kinase n=3 Tax=Nocardiopsis gilva TaxID=280236 RepID=A0A223S6V9_9ACTN|nr:ATP-binding protein [Nocardiopsis gilva YIM 90087]
MSWLGGSAPSASVPQPPPVTPAGEGTAPRTGAPPAPPPPSAPSEAAVPPAASAPDGGRDQGAARETAIPEPAAPQVAAFDEHVSQAGYDHASAAEQTAIDAAAARQARLMTDTLANLAMRDLTLIDSLLAVVEDLEETSDDPDLLERLFKIDNLATRMRRNGENLLVLAGQEIDDPRTDPVPLLDVARAAISEISDYDRVQVGRLPSTALAGSAADDLSHLLAELLDNATAKSPAHAQVVISGQRMSDGRVLLAVEDEGIGISREQIDDLNYRLNGKPVLDEQVIRHMGLYVVSLLAQQHGFEVQLESRAFRGISAFVIVPTELLRASSPYGAPTQEPRPSMPALVSPSAPPASPTGRHAPHSDSDRSPVTSAGLPRRTANRSQTAQRIAEGMDMPPTDEGAEPHTPTDSSERAARISADLDGFVQGEQAASSQNDP